MIWMEEKIWWNASKQQMLKRRDSIVWVLITTIVWCIVKYKNIVIYIYIYISFDFGRTWWRLFQKRVVRTKFDIYVVLYIHATASNVVDILSFNIVGLQCNDLCWCQVCKVRDITMYPNKDISTQCTLCNVMEVFIGGILMF